MSTAVEVPIMENEHVKEFLSIMQDNGKDTGNITELLSYVTTMESQLTKAVEELTSMRRELAGMREEHDHPVRTALEKAARSLEAAINETRQRLNEIKDKIVDGCKQAVTSFKENGIAALNGIAKFFRIKPALESLRNNLQGDIKHDQAAIAKIESIGAQYHSAGMHLRNVGRALSGKEAITAIKPNGKLAKLAAAPFRTEMKCLQNALKDTNRAIAVLDRLDRAVQQKAAEQAERKPSVKETMQKLQKQINAERADSPAPAKAKHRGTEL